MHTDTENSTETTVSLTYWLLLLHLMLCCSFSCMDTGDFRVQRSWPFWNVNCPCRILEEVGISLLFFSPVEMLSFFTYWGNNAGFSSQVTPVCDLLKTCSALNVACLTCFIPKPGESYGQEIIRNFYPSAMVQKKDGQVGAGRM